MAEIGKLSFVRHLPRATTAGLGAAAFIAPTAAQAQTVPKCVVPVPPALARQLRHDAVHQIPVPLSPDAGVITGPNGGFQQETVVSITPTTPDAQVNYVIPELPRGSQHMSQAKILKSLHYVEIPEPCVTMVVEELFEPLHADPNNKDLYTLSSFSTTGVINVNDPGHSPEARILLSNGERPWVNIGLTMPYTPPPSGSEPVLAH